MTPAPALAYAPPPRVAQVVTPPEFRYAGFWRRFVAVFIDGLILAFVTFPAHLIFHVPWIGWMNSEDLSPEEIGAMLVTAMWAGLLSTVISWLYFSLFECSKRQATPGKMALNIQVADLRGHRVSFARASGRYFGKILSALFLGLGYLFQPFTARRQALHDLVAGTLVLRRETGA